MMMRTTTDMTCGYNIYNFSDKNHRGKNLMVCRQPLRLQDTKAKLKFKVSVMWGNDNTTCLRVA